MKRIPPLLFSVVFISQVAILSSPLFAAEPTAQPGAIKKASPTEELRTISLVAGPASVVASNVNVRGRAGLAGEVLTRISQGDQVTVIEEITLKRSKNDEPSAWAKITLPLGAHVWVNGSFVDESTKSVKPKKLNLRGGPGENYSVIGTIEKGASVKEIQTKGAWMEIEPPPGVFAFVAAQYLKQESGIAAGAAPIAPVVGAPTPEPAPAPVVVPEPTAVVTKPVDAPVPAPTPTPEPLPTLPVVTPPPALETPNEPTPPRVVQHEGIVKGAWSIQAPTRFALVSPDTGKTINYLYTTSTNLDLRRYKGLRIVVTGEEGLDRRWRNTPVITIRRIQVVE